MNPIPEPQSNPVNIDWTAYRAKCEWLDVPKSTKSIFDQTCSATAVSTTSVKILSWNILAQTLIRRELFPTSSYQALKWGTRRENLLAEIQVYNGDILCLQELDFYNEFWKPSVVESQTLGYGSGYWKQKARKSDGVAIIWRKSMFEEVARQDIDYDELCKQEPYANGGVGCDLNELSRGNVGQILALRHVGISRPTSQNESGSSNTVAANCADEGVIIFNAHLFWNPRYNYVRLVQMVIALEQIVAFKQKHGLNWPVVMCGDYNNSSGDPAYEALFERQNLTELWRAHDTWLTPPLHYSKYQAWVVPPPAEVLNQESPKPAPPQTKEEQQIRLQRVESILNRLESLELPLPISIYRNYREVDPNNPEWETTHQPSRLEPPFTAFSPFWCGPLDYISVWDPHSSSKDTCRLIPQKLLRVPLTTEIGPPSSIVKSDRIPNPVALPNDVRASDHVPIMVQFELRPI